MRSKRAIALAAIVLTAAFGIGHFAKAFPAPEGPRGRGPGFPDIRHMAEELNLTEEQKTALRGFLEDSRTQMQALRNDTTLTREQRQERMREIAQRTQDNFRSILSVEQHMKADELRQRAEERVTARRQQTSDRAFDGLVKRLDLSEAQQTTIQSYREEERAQLQALRDDTTLTREQRLEQARTIRQQTQEKIRSTLTADQQTRLDQLRQQGRDRIQDRRDRRRGGPGSRGPRGAGPRRGAQNL